MPNNTLTSYSPVAVKEADKTEALLISNAKYVSALSLISESDSDEGTSARNEALKETKVNLYLINDPSDEENRPFFLATYHGDSSGKMLEKDMSNIISRIKEHQQTIKMEYDFNVADVVVTGDFNVSLLKQDPESKKISIDRDALTRATKDAWDMNCKLVDVAPPQGIFSKKRGGSDNAPLNIFINPQIKKERQLMSDDSKAYSLHFKLTDSESPTSFIECIDNIIKKDDHRYENKDFLKDNTSYKDHANSKPLKVGGVVINSTTNLPTEGKKGGRNAKDIYREGFYEAETNAPTAEVTGFQQKSTSRLMGLCQGIFDTDNIQEMKTSEADNITSDAYELLEMKTSEDISGFVKKLDDHVKSLSLDERKNKFTMIISLWESSAEHTKLLGTLKDTYIAENEIPGKMSDIVKKMKDKDSFSDIIKKIAQAQQQELLNGYEYINGKKPTPKQMIEINSQTAVSDAEKSKQESFLTVITEGGPVQQHKDVIHKTKTGTINLNFSEWHKKLDRHRACIILDNDWSIFSTQKSRNQAIDDAKRALNSYAEALIQETCDENASKNDIFIDSLNSIKTIGERLSEDTALSRLFNQMIVDLGVHLAQRSSAFVSDKLSEEQVLPLTVLVERQKIWRRSASNESQNLFSTIYQKIEDLSTYIDTFADGEEKTAGTKLVYDMTNKLRQYGEGEHNRENFRMFCADFKALAHAEKTLTNHRRSYYGLVADIVASIFSLGLFPLYNWSQGNIGYFHKPTTREQRVKAIVDSLENDISFSNNKSSLGCS